MNAKQAKRLRRRIRQALSMVNPEIGEQSAVSTDSTYIRGLVPSQRYNSTVNGEVQKDMAPQVRVSPESFRGIYLRTKARVKQNALRGQSRQLGKSSTLPANARVASLETPTRQDTVGEVLQPQIRSEETRNRIPTVL